MNPGIFVRLAVTYRGHVSMLLPRGASVLLTLINLPRKSELSNATAASICSGSENSTYAYLDSYKVNTQAHQVGEA